MEDIDVTIIPITDKHESITYLKHIRNQPHINVITEKNMLNTSKTMGVARCLLGASNKKYHGG